MAEDFEKLNKQVAAFIVVSAALSVPAVNADPMIEVSPSIMRYAGPINPNIYVIENPVPYMPIARYAGPINPLPQVDINQINANNLINQTKINADIQNAAKLEAQVAPNSNAVNVNGNAAAPTTDFGGQQLSPSHFLFK